MEIPPPVQPSPRRLRAVPAPATVPSAAEIPAAITVQPKQPPPHDVTIRDLLTQSKRETVPVRKDFVQQAPGSASRVGPLAQFVTRRDARGLDAYLFIHALASAEPWTCTYPSDTWARVLDLSSSCEEDSAKAAVSKVLKRLEDRRLIARKRVGRRTEVTLLREDGTGEPYTRPKQAADGVWLTLPYAYWTEGFYKTLTLPAKAMLLIGSSLAHEFVLPQERMPAWYGISADTAARGFDDLRKAGLLTSRDEFVRDHKVPTGWRQVQHHRLLEPFDLASRTAAAKNAGRRRRRAEPEEAVVRGETASETA
jgi:hypothetical protein